jgi:hypothetical protein
VSYNPDSKQGHLIKPQTARASTKKHQSDGLEVRVTCTN